MKNILRSTIVVAGLATTTLIGMTSANAAVAAEFTGEATIASFGTGDSTGTAKLCVNGSLSVGSTSVQTATCVGGFNATATFSLTEESATCPATGAATGTVTVSTSAGSKSGGFTWRRVGATAVITGTSGVLAGTNGVAVFAVTSGLVCGQTNVKATVAGSLVGA